MSHEGPLYLTWIITLRRKGTINFWALAIVDLCYYSNNFRYFTPYFVYLGCVRNYISWYPNCAGINTRLRLSRGYCHVSEGPKNVHIQAIRNKAIPHGNLLAECTRACRLHSRTRENHISNTRFIVHCGFCIYTLRLYSKLREERNEANLAKNRLFSYWFWKSVNYLGHFFDFRRRFVFIFILKNKNLAM